MSRYEEALKNLSYDVSRLCKEMGWEMDNKDIEVMKELIKEKSDLEAKLAEKEKEIESLKHFKVTIGTMENNQVDISSTTYTDQDKIEFAIAELIKFKETLIKFLQDEGFYETEWYDLFDEVDQQIKELKEKK